MDLASVFALQTIIFAVRIGQDWLIGFVKGSVCPYAELKVARR